MVNFHTNDFDLTSKQGRQEWIKKYGNNLFLNLTPTMKFDLFVLFYAGSFENIYKKKHLLGGGYSMIFRNMNLLADLGLVDKAYIGLRKKCVFTITEKGQRFCSEFIALMKE